MAESAPPAAAEFDLQRASDRLYPFTKRSRWVSIITAIFLVLFGLFILAISWSAIARGALSNYQKFDLSVVLVIVVGGLVLMLRLIPRQIKSAISLRVDDAGFELAYPNGRRIARAWLDSGLDFDVLDFSGANPSILPTADFPYRISVRGVTSLLTNEAYHAIINQVSRHGLVDSVERGGRWLYPANANPVIHHIRAPRSTAP
jgi:hypothetical protein